jgi:hypothetical protein
MSATDQLETTAPAIAMTSPAQKVMPRSQECSLNDQLGRPVREKMIQRR